MTPPVIPDGVEDCHNTFRECFQLTKAGRIPKSVTECTFMFYDCFRLKEGAVCVPNESRVCRSMYCGCVNLETIYDLECSDLTSGKYLDCFSLKLDGSQFAELRLAGLLNSKRFADTFPNCTSLLKKCFVPALPFHSLITIGVAAEELGKTIRELVEQWVMPFMAHGILPGESVDHLVSGVEEVSRYVVGQVKECSIPNQSSTDELFNQQLNSYRRTV